MHEMAITENLVKIVKEAAQQNAVQQVHAVRVKIGRLRQVIPETLQFCFGVLARGTVAEQASLEIEEIPVTVKCRTCNSESVIEEYVFLCPACGGGDVQVVSGKELYVSTIECD